jgi:SulP family sulfate permease
MSAGKVSGKDDVTASALPQLWNRLGSIATETLAGVIVAALSIAYAVSFAALLFQNELQGGFATGLWSLLMSMVITGIYVNLTTSIPPLSAGPDTPVVAVATLLAGAVAAKILAAGGSPSQAVLHTLLSFSLMTLLAGATIYLIGALRWGQALRFVPYPVVAGFLAATGWLLMIGSYKVLTGAALTMENIAAALPWTMLPQAGVAAAFAAVLLALRSRIKAPYFLPAAFFGTAAILDLALWAFVPASQSWFLGGAQNLSPWFPLAAATSDIDWRIMASVLPEMTACVVVGLVSLLVKISSLETTRAVAADIDREFRANGAASLIAAPLGAMAGSVLVGPSKVFLDAGARTRLSGIAASGVIALVVIAGVDIPGWVPKPILAGIVFVLGYAILIDALKGAFNQRSWLEFALAIAIAIICVQFGYIIGVIAGFICACLIFAFTYGRIGVVRHQLSRASFSGGIERAPDMERALRKDGEAIQVYWLSGYIFFGSSEGLFERIRRSIEAQTATPVRYVTMDFAGVSGVDSSAIASLVKLKNFCDKRSVTLVYCGLSDRLRAVLEGTNLFGAGKLHVAFPARMDALNWIEERLLQDSLSRNEQPPLLAFDQWLRSELGRQIAPDLITTYFERKEYSGGEVLYRQGDSADSIEFVTSGSLALMLGSEAGKLRRIRLSTRQTVVGEMGFFRHAPRAVTICAEGPTVTHCLSRERWERLRREQPDVHEALLIFIIRTLSDRLELAHKEIAALT